MATITRKIECDQQYFLGVRIRATLQLLYQHPNKCGTADVVTTGTWTFIENDTKVTFVDATNGTQTFTLSELTSTSLKLSGVQTYQGNAVNVTAIFTGN